jgi:hypothetical protein
LHCFPETRTLELASLRLYREFAFRDCWLAPDFRISRLGIAKNRVFPFFRYPKLRVLRDQIDGPDFLGINGPDPLSHFAISHFATSRLGQDNSLHASDSIPDYVEFLNHLLDGQISSTLETNGPDLLEHQRSRSSLAFRDFATLGNNILRAPDSRLSSSRNHLSVDDLLH